jgi:hypothetical protein
LATLYQILNEKKEEEKRYALLTKNKNRQIEVLIDLFLTQNDGSYTSKRGH